jgi:Ca2+-binding EF-hand superfamily protein
MAAVLDVPVTEHSTDDFFLYCHANRNRVQLDQAFEASAIKSLFGVDITGLKALLDRFAAADADKNGWLEPSELCTIAGLDPESAEASVLFGFFDTKVATTIMIIVATNLIARSQTAFGVWYTVGVLLTPTATCCAVFTIFQGTGRVDFAEFVCGIAVLSDNLNEADHLKLAFLIMEV